MPKAKYSVRISLGRDDEGNRVRKTIYGNTKVELERNRTKAIAESAYLRNPSEITFEKYYEKWFEAYKSHESLNTQAMYNYIFSCLDSIKHKKVKDIKRSDLQLIVNKYWDRPTSAKQIVMGLKAVFKMAAADGIIIANPAEGLAKPKLIKTEKRILRPAELQAIKNADLDDMERTFVNILFYFGLRPGEALALMKKDFDFVSKTLIVSKALTFDVNQPILKGTKTDNVRKFPIPDAVCGQLKKYIKGCRCPYLFHKQDNTMITKSAYTKMWYRIKKKINIALGGNSTFDLLDGFSPYTFRRNFATNLYYSNVTIKKAAQLMGHCDTKMIMEVYAQIDDSREDLEALRKMSM